MNKKDHKLLVAVEEDWRRIRKRLNKPGISCGRERGTRDKQRDKAIAWWNIWDHQK